MLDSDTLSGGSSPYHDWRALQLSHCCIADGVRVSAETAFGRGSTLRRLRDLGACPWAAARRVIPRCPRSPANLDKSAMNACR